VDPSVRIIEIQRRHAPVCVRAHPGRGAGGLDLGPDDQVRRDYLSRQAFEALASRIGITPGTTLVFYGDKNNWWACYAFWSFSSSATRRPRSWTVDA